MKNLNLAILFVLAAILSGCAGGRSYDYTAIPIDLHLEGNNNKIALGVHDQRAYVRNGDKYPQYVGTQRSPAYVPWNINTKSGLPMADDFLQDIGKSLKTDGYIVDLISLPAKENKKQVLVRLKKTGDNRLLLFTINEWYFDIWYKTRMSYSMKLEVFDNNLKLLASSNVENKMWNDNDNAVPGFEFKTAVKKLLTDHSIDQALNQNLTYFNYSHNPNNIKSEPVKDKRISKNHEVVARKSQQATKPIPSRLTATKIKCTTEQILKMKEMGMADGQIKAACQ